MTTTISESNIRARLLESVSLRTTSRVDSVLLNGTGYDHPAPMPEGQDIQHFEEWDFIGGTWIFALVLDGHGKVGNNAAAKFIQAELPPLVKASVASGLDAAQSRCLPDADIGKILSDHLVALDDHIKDDVVAALADESLADRETILSRAATGTTVCVAVVDPFRRVHVAHIGDSDCFLVSGMAKESSHLTPRHTCTNPAEKQRIIGEHPNEPSSDLFHARRILGRVILSRAIGDFMCKLAAPQVKQLLLWMNESESEADPTIVHNHTPPYLSNKPDITHVQADEGDVLVLASDGLADQVWWRDGHVSTIESVGRTCGAGLSRTPSSGFNSALEILWEAWLGVVDTHMYRLVVNKYSPSGRVDDVAIIVVRV